MMGFFFRRGERGRDPYRVLALLPPHGRKGVVALLDVDVQQMVRGEVPAALDAPVGVRLVVVGFVRAVRAERQGLPVRRQRAAHHHHGVLGRCVHLDHLRGRAVDVGRRGRPSGVWRGARPWWCVLPVTVSGCGVATGGILFFLFFAPT